MIAQIQQSKWQGCQFTSDYRGKDYTASLTLGETSIYSVFGPPGSGSVTNCTDPKPDPDPSINKQKNKKNLVFCYSVLS
jgi:hypothetical protein